MAQKYTKCTLKQTGAGTFSGVYNLSSAWNINLAINIKSPLLFLGHHQVMI